MNRVFVDMDGVLVDFEGYARALALPNEQVTRLAGAYLAMAPIPGALEAVRSLLEMQWEVWIATKPPTGIPQAYADKAGWILQHLPELRRRIILTHDKGLLGDAGDYLIDDRPHKANCHAFKGRLIPFTPACQWPHVLELLRAARRQPEEAA